jgi:hypothetical protein
MSDRIHAPVHPLQPSLLDPPRNRIPRQPDRRNLSMGHQAMLPGRNSREPLVGVCSHLLPVCGTRWRHTPRLPGRV